jgi:hypothetical protein
MFKSGTLKATAPFNSALQPSAFAVGPAQWKGKWIVLPSDYDTLGREEMAHVFWHPPNHTKGAL